jgi:hypothetical protein
MRDSILFSETVRKALAPWTGPRGWVKVDVISNPCPKDIALIQVMWTWCESEPERPVWLTGLAPQEAVDHD